MLIIGSETTGENATVGDEYESDVVRGGFVQRVVRATADSQILCE